MNEITKKRRTIPGLMLRIAAPIYDHTRSVAMGSRCGEHSKKGNESDTPKIVHNPRGAFDLSLQSIVVADFLLEPPSPFAASLLETYAFTRFGLCNSGW